LSSAYRKKLKKFFGINPATEDPRGGKQKKESKFRHI